MELNRFLWGLLAFNFCDMRIDNAITIHLEFRSSMTEKEVHEFRTKVCSLDEYSQYTHGITVNYVHQSNHMTNSICVIISYTKDEETCAMFEKVLKFLKEKIHTKIKSAFVSTPTSRFTFDSYREKGILSNFFIENKEYKYILNVDKI